MINTLDAFRKLIGLKDRFNEKVFSHKLRMKII